MISRKLRKISIMILRNNTTLFLTEGIVTEN
jgi:hypothetical protein